LLNFLSRKPILHPVNTASFYNYQKNTFFYQKFLESFFSFTPSILIIIMQRFVIYFFFALLSVPAYAQHAGIKGIVLGKLNNEPLEYASVSLYRTSDSTLVTGAVSQAGGTFELTRLKAGDYYIKAHFIGYQARIIPDIVLTANQKLTIGTIMLSPDQRLLNEITVTGQKINVMNKLDKQTYKADQFEAAKGGSAIDVLKNMPSVSVNGQGDITL